MVTVSEISRICKVGAICIVATETADKVCVIKEVTIENELVHISFLSLRDSVNITIIEYLNDMEITESTSSTALMVYSKFNMIFFNKLIDLSETQANLIAEVKELSSKVETLSLLLSNGLNIR